MPNGASETLSAVKSMSALTAARREKSMRASGMRRAERSKAALASFCSSFTVSSLSVPGRKTEDDAHVVEVELLRFQRDGQHWLFVGEVDADEAVEIAVAHRAGEVFDGPDLCLRREGAGEIEGRRVGRGGADDFGQLFQVLAFGRDTALQRAAPVALQAIEGDAVVAGDGFGLEAGVGERALGRDDGDLARFVVDREPDQDVLGVDIVDIALRLEGFAAVIVVLLLEHQFAVANADAVGPDAAGQPAEEVVADVEFAGLDGLGPVERAEDEGVGEGVFEVAGLHPGGLVAEGSDGPVDHLGAGGRIGEHQVEHDPACDEDAEDGADRDQQCLARAPFEVADAFAAGGVDARRRRPLSFRTLDPSRP